MLVNGPNSSLIQVQKENEQDKVYIFQDTYSESC